MLVYAALALGCALLYKGGDWLLDGVTALGARAGLSKAIIGLCLVSLGTSAPELFVSVASALQSHGALAAGNVVGSNIINSAVVLGIAASVVVLNVERVLQKQLLSMLAVSVLAVVILGDSHVSRAEGLILLLTVVISFLFAFRSQGKVVANADLKPSEHRDTPTMSRSLMLTVAGILTLLVGAETLIWGGLELASQFSVPEAVVALTVTAIGTSLPEIAATVVAVVRREASLAVGNVVGSNLLNVGLVLGMSALAMPLDNVDLGVFSLGYFILLAVLLTGFGMLHRQYPRWFGMSILASYGIYVGALLLVL